MLFDVDGTLTDGGPVVPDMLPLLRRAQAHGYHLGLCTARSFGEVLDFLTRELGLSSDTDGCFMAGMLLEDGHVWLPPGRIAAERLQILTSAAALQDMHRFEQQVHTAWAPVTDPKRAAAGWGTLADIQDILVQLLPTQWRPRGSLSIWKEGLDTPWPAYQVEQDAVVRWARQQVAHLGLHHCTIAEAGGGSLRVVERGRDKGTAALQVGYALDRLIFCGDSMNDVPIATRIHAAGGLVLAVNNAVPALKQLAVYVARQPASAGTAEVLAWLLDPCGTGDGCGDWD
jgi:hypothetical protein